MKYVYTHCAVTLYTLNLRSCRLAVGVAVIADSYALSTSLRMETTNVQLQCAERCWAWGWARCASLHGTLYAATVPVPLVALVATQHAVDRTLGGWCVALALGTPLCPLAH